MICKILTKFVRKLQKALNVRYWLRQFASDNEYGDWVKRSIPEKLNTAKKRTTTVNLLNLASGVGHYQKIPHTEQTESHYSTTDNLLNLASGVAHYLKMRDTS